MSKFSELSETQKAKVVDHIPASLFDASDAAYDEYYDALQAVLAVPTGPSVAALVAAWALNEAANNAIEAASAEAERRLGFVS